MVQCCSIKVGHDRNLLSIDLFQCWSRYFLRDLAYFSFYVSTLLMNRVRAKMFWSMLKHRHHQRSSILRLRFVSCRLVSCHFDWQSNRLIHEKNRPSVSSILIQIFDTQTQSWWSTFIVNRDFHWVFAWSQLILSIDKFLPVEYFFVLLVSMWFHEMYTLFKKARWPSISWLNYSAEYSLFLFFSAYVLPLLSSRIFCLSHPLF